MRFLMILILAFVLIAGAVFFFYTSNQEALVNLDGEILKVRTYQLTPGATIVIADFRVTNPDRVPFVVKKVSMQLETADGERVDGLMLSRQDIDNMFAYQQLAGPQYNDPLLGSDRVPPGESWDRMVAARVDLAEPDVARRSNLMLTIEELDGLVSVVSEEPIVEQGEAPREGNAGGSAE